MVSVKSRATSPEIRDRFKLEIALTALDEVLAFQMSPHKCVAEMVRLKMNVRKALDDIRKLETSNT